jgi:sporulation protein YqfC
MYRKKRLNDMLEIPKEVYSNIPNFIITGFEEMIIENYKGILEYEDFYVRVNTFIGIINIHGINLKLDKMTEDNLKITGKIEKIDIERTVDE